MSRLNNNKQTHIELKGNRVVIRYGSKRWATGYTLSNTIPYDKQFANEKLLSVWDRNSYKDANNAISHRKQYIDKLLLEVYAKQIDPITYLNAHFSEANIKTANLATARERLVVDAFREYITNVKEKSRKTIKPVSIAPYYTKLHLLEQFDPSRKLGEITMDWVFKLCDYIASDRDYIKTIDDKKKKAPYQLAYKTSMQDASIIRFLKDLKSFLVEEQKTYSHFSFPIEEIEEYINTLRSKQSGHEEIIAMNREQWEEFLALEPTLKKRWEKNTYYLYKLCVYTGLRWSDLMRLDSSYIRQNIIKMRTQKTNTYIEVPLVQEAIKILERYNYVISSNLISNGRQNVHLRNLLKRLPSFQGDTQKTIFKLGKPIRSTVKLYELFTWHSSRRTFVSFCVRNGNTIDQIKLFLGWKTTETILHYMSVFSEKNTHKDLPSF